MTHEHQSLHNPTQVGTVSPMATSHNPTATQKGTNTMTTYRLTAEVRETLGHHPNTQVNHVRAASKDERQWHEMMTESWTTVKVLDTIVLTDGRVLSVALDTQATTGWRYMVDCYRLDGSLLSFGTVDHPLYEDDTIVEVQR